MRSCAASRVLRSSLRSVQLSKTLLNSPQLKVTKAIFSRIRAYSNLLEASWKERQETLILVVDLLPLFSSSVSHIVASYSIGAASLIAFSSSSVILASISSVSETAGISSATKS